MPADPTPTPRVDLEELVAEGRRLLAKATERPWYRGVVDERGATIKAVEGGGDGPLRTMAVTFVEPDAALIVAAINALPDLLEAVEYAGRCEKALVRARQTLSQIADYFAEQGDQPSRFATRMDLGYIDAALARPHPDEEADRDAG